MKRLLIISDSRMYKTKNNELYKVSIDNNHYARYLQFSEKINLLMRVEEINENEKNKMNHITLPQINMIECPTIMTLKGLLFNYTKAKKIIKEQIKKADYIIFKAPGIFCNIAYRYTRKYNKMYFAEIGGCPFDGYWNHGINGKIMAPYMFFSTRRLMKNAQYSLYVTRYFLEKRYPTKGKYISCSNVTLEDINEETINNRINRIKNIYNPKNIVLCTIADVDVKFKGQQYVIKAIPKIKEELGINIKYVLIGRGNNSYLKKVAKRYNALDNVVFMGPIKHEEIFKELDNIDIYVQPSRQEGLPRAVIEAMSCGIPCFGANTAGIPELIEKKYIFSNSRNNINEIINIIDNIKEKDEMIRVAKKNFNDSKEYEFNYLKDKRERIYQEYMEKVANEKKD